MPRRGTEAERPAETWGGLAKLARDATSGDVDESVHVAGRARFLAAVKSETETETSRMPMRLAMAMAAAVALVIGGWGVQRWRAPEWTVEGAVASEGFVRAPATGNATIEFADGSAVVLAPSARARMVRGETRHVVLEEGRAEVRVARGRPQLAWSFDAGPFMVRPSQGGLALSWSGDSEQLDVWPHDAETTVQGGAAGTGVTLHGGDHLTARVREGELRVVRADGITTTTSNAAPPSPVDPGSAIVTTTPASPTDSTPTLNPGAPSAASTPSTPPAPRASWSALVARGDYDSVLRDADAAGIDAVLARRPLADLAALADASRYRGQTDLSQRALTTERSRFGSSKEAHTAAFLLGRLADDQSHDGAQAIGWYDRYLAEAPTGPFASDALGRKMIAVERTRGADAARPIAEQYARRFPHGAYAAQAEELRTR